ncbi:quinone-dependent dihydroorotate dehydrogenase [Campylobacter fetus]|nr:quinone-dependent dihydroorotate dehydrogenase [Campylobacter fetus]EAI5945333.1 quinone-dependent dihydroorotate dehydrogenase [Campylobacter fetus]EAJ1238290.1 quinone-dependent dihydroorotate dehydrogenase [Campylobacter fetus]EAK5904927.1 quinone-dependent dihydroorotate dehydrogenase [Campylobacter fetus]EAK7493887.1 quinone-dependent dihydroorotate dehydrogenase [Campylobacter fetus]
MDYRDIKKLFFKLDPETAHKIAECGLRTAANLPFAADYLVDKFCYTDTKLSQNIFGLNFLNPVGLAGGFDKNATMLRALLALGFGYLEYGTLTPKPQPGNPKPRLFRLIEEKSIQNAMGFNNDGVDKIKKRVEKLYPFAVPLFANIGKNKITPNEEAIKDYELLVRELSGFCDAFVLNLSSPNTPNLRDLQEDEFITELFEIIKPLTNKPIILKISPDIKEDKAIQICLNAANLGIDAIIVNNTSIDYSLSSNAKNFGGLSGALITQKSKEMFKNIAKELFGKTILISCGGIDNAKEAYERIKMGASLVQIYTSFIFEGPSICKNINKELVNLLTDDGFENISQAIGANLRK